MRFNIDTKQSKEAGFSRSCGSSETLPEIISGIKDAMANITITSA